MKKYSSAWQSGLSKMPANSRLNKSEIADVAIIGGGMTGLLCAYKLSRMFDVLVVDKNIPGSGATGLTTAFLTQVVDTDYSELAEVFGRKEARMIWESHGRAIDLIEKIISKEKIECEFKRVKNFNYANSVSENSQLKEELSVLKKLKIPAAFGNENLGFHHFGYLEYSNQAKFHPVKFLNGLAAAVIRQGGRIYGDSEIEDITHQKEFVILKSGSNLIRAKHVIVATHNPFNKPVTMHFRKGEYTTYILEAQITSGQIAEGLYEDLETPYHYFRIDKGNRHDRLIIGGEDHRSDLPVSAANSFRALENYLKTIISDRQFKITNRWTGPILEPVDGLAVIGAHPIQKQEYYATGFSGTGLTYAAISANILSDLIKGKNNIYSKLYTPSRISSFKQLFKKGIDYTQEFIGGAVKNSLHS